MFDDDRENDKTKLFANNSSFPDVFECKEKITKVTKEIGEHRRQVRLTLRQPALEYCTLLGTEVNTQNLNLSDILYIQYLYT
jgi:hypothetical protein